MAKIKSRDLKNMPLDELNKKLSELKKELMKLRAQMTVGTNIESPGRVKSTKRMIARILTLLKIKEVKKTNE